MRLCRFDNGRLGVVEGDTLRDVTAALDVLPVYRYPLPACDPLIRTCRPLPSASGTLLPSAPTPCRCPAATLLSPVANPGKVVAAPVNYQKHLDEVRGDEGLHHQNPINTIHKAGLFLKATSALAGAGEGIALRKARPAQRSRDRTGVRHRQDRAQRLEGSTPSNTSPAMPSGSTSRFAVPRSAACGSRPTPTPSWARGW